MSNPRSLGAAPDVRQRTVRRNQGLGVAVPAYEADLRRDTRTASDRPASRNYTLAQLSPAPGKITTRLDNSPSI